MKKIKVMLKKLTFLTKVISCTVTLFLMLDDIAIARYVIPRNRKPPSDYSRTTGIRGCPELTVLAPKTHVGESSSSHPTLAWFIFNASEKVPMLASDIKLELYEINSNKLPQLITQPIFLKMSPGIMKYSLSEIQLNKDKSYLWQIAVRCLNGEVIQSAELRIVEMPSSLIKALTIPTNTAKKVDLYAEAGLWYDALTEAFSLAENGKLGEVGSNLVQSLAQVETEQTPLSLTEPNCEKRVDCKEIQERVRRLEQMAISTR